MLTYNPNLRQRASALRANMTECERLLWYYLRNRRLTDIQFYRQKPIGQYIVDFYSPAAKLVIELDGGQHFEEEQKAYDQKRTAYLEQQGLEVLRFSNLDILQSMSSVLSVILDTVVRRKLW